MLYLQVYVLYIQIFVETKSSFTADTTCEKDCNLQYLNILNIISIKDPNSSISQSTRESTTLDILSNIIKLTKERLWMEIKDPKNSLDNIQILEDEESYLMGSILNNLLISKGEGETDINIDISESTYKNIKAKGEELALLLTRSISPDVSPRVFIGTKMRILAMKGSKEINNLLEGEVLQFTTMEDKIENKTTAESNLININLIEWESSIYNINTKEKEKIISTKIGTYNIYDTEQTTKIVNKSIEFKTYVNFTGMNNTQIQNIYCVYYDQKNNNFSTKGIQVIERNVEFGYLTCNSTHLSDFGAANIHNETAVVLQNAYF